MATCQKDTSSASPELLAPDRSVTSAATQTELLSKNATTQVSDCKVCARIFLEMEGDSKQDCGRCDQVDELLCLVAQLQEEVGRLRSLKRRLMN